MFSMVYKLCKVVVCNYNRLQSHHHQLLCMFYLPSKERNFDTYRSIVKILHNFAHSSPSSFLLNNVLNIILEAEGCDDWCACECRLNLTIIKKFAFMQLLKKSSSIVLKKRSYFTITSHEFLLKISHTTMCRS